MAGSGHLHDNISSMMVAKVAFSGLSGFWPMSCFQLSPHTGGITFGCQHLLLVSGQEVETQGRKISGSHFSTDNILMALGLATIPLAMHSHQGGTGLGPPSF